MRHGFAYERGRPREGDRGAAEGDAGGGAHIPDATLDIIGDGEDRARREAVAGELGLSNFVHFRVPVSDDELHRCLASMDLFVLPSSKEGFGLVFLEAGGAHGGTPEVVVDEKTAVLVDRTDRQALESALVRLLLDDDTRHAMGAAGWRRLRERFTFDAFSGLVRNLLEETSGDQALAA